jgi:hypothetical protein
MSYPKICRKLLVLGTGSASTAQSGGNYPPNIHNVADAVTTQIRVSAGGKAQSGIDGDLDIQVVNDIVVVN